MFSLTGGARKLLTTSKLYARFQEAPTTEPSEVVIFGRPQEFFAVRLLSCQVVAAC